MSSLHDPFDLIGTGQEMDNVVPFLAPNKVNQMIESALTRQQVAPQAYPRGRLAVGTWKFAGMGIAACLAFLMIFAAPQQEQMGHMIVGEPAAIVSAVQEPEVMQTASVDDQEDVREFGDFVMLETLERY